MWSAAFETFRQAALRKQRLSFSYKGLVREACPHIVGWTAGSERALIFQFAGQSSRTLAAGGDWRCVNLDEVRDLVVVDGPWMTATHSHAQHCVNKVAVGVS